MNFPSAQAQLAQNLIKQLSEQVPNYDWDLFKVAADAYESAWPEDPKVVWEAYAMRWCGAKKRGPGLRRPIVRTNLERSHGSGGGSHASQQLALPDKPWFWAISERDSGTLTVSDMDANQQALLPTAIYLMSFDHRVMLFTGKRRVYHKAFKEFMGAITWLSSGLLLLEELIDWKK